MKRAWWSLILVVAVLMKLALFFYAEARAPEVKFKFDSQDYIMTGRTLVHDGAFARGRKGDGTFFYESYRTPGYPLFIGFLHHILGWSFPAIVLLQLLITLFTAGMTYVLAREAGIRWPGLAAVIMLFDLPTTISALAILTETLFTALLVLVVFFLVRFIKQPHWLDMVLAGIILAAAVYVRPIGIGLGGSAVSFLGLGGGPETPGVLRYDIGDLAGAGLCCDRALDIA